MNSRYLNFLSAFTLWSTAIIFKATFKGPRLSLCQLKVTPYLTSKLRYLNKLFRDELEAQKSKGFFGFLRRLFTWKKKAPKVTEDEKVEETQEENKEEVTSEPVTEQNGDEAQEVDGQEVEEKSAEIEKDSLNTLCNIGYARIAEIILCSRNPDR